MTKKTKGIIMPKEKKPDSGIAGALVVVVIAILMFGLFGCQPPAHL